MQNYEEFAAQVRKLNESRTHEVTNSLGVYDIYKYIRKNKWFNIPRPLTEKEFYSIIRTVNKYIAEALSLGNDINLPYKLGTLEIRKKPAIIKFEDGKLKTNLHINWKATVDLWYKDRESYNNRTLVRDESKELFKIHYNKQKAVFNNKSFYDFKPNRELKRALARNIKAGLIDAYLLYKYGLR